MKLPRFFQRKRAVAFVLLLSVTTLVVCQLIIDHWPSRTFTPEQYQKASIKYLKPRKEGSLESWKSIQIGDVDALDFVLERTSLVVACDLPLRVVSDSKEEEVEKPTSEPASDRPPIGSGTATAITSDGYWLTAAHVVQFEHAYLGAFAAEDPTGASSSTAQALYPIRVVWTGAMNDPKLPDLALIHCEHLPDKHFPLLRAPEFAEGMEVLATGYGGGKPSPSGGVLLRGSGQKSPKESDARWRIYTSDVPVVPGDSGGPLMNAEGQLLGVNVGGFIAIRSFLGWPRLHAYHSDTVIPDTDWIRQLILADRAAHKPEA